MEKRPRPKGSGQNFVSFDEAAETILKFSKRYAQNNEIKTLLERTNKWHPADSIIEQQVSAELKIAYDRLVELNKFIATINVDFVEEKLEERLAVRYYEPIESQLTAMATFHSGSILTEKVFDRMADRSVVELTLWLLGRPEKYDFLRQLQYSFDPSYWKHRIKTVRKSSYLFEQVEQPKNAGLLEFTAQIVRHEHLVKGTKKLITPHRNFKIYRQMIGHRYFLYCSTAGLVPTAFMDRLMGIGYGPYDIRVLGQEMISMIRTFARDIREIPVFLGEIENGTIEMRGTKTGYNIRDSVILFEPFIVQVKENKDWIN